jgi:hypothetical protein
MSARAILLLTVACTCVSRSACADDWYGWQTLGTDVAAFATLGGGATAENPYVAAAVLPCGCSARQRSTSHTARRTGQR